MSLQLRRERYITLHMWKILHKHTSNDLNIQFRFNSRLGYIAKIPPLNKKSTCANKSLYDSSFAVVGPKLWNAIPHQLNKISNLQTFKSHITKFLLYVPDMPPIKDYSTANSNSILDWRINREASALWGGDLMLWPC